MRYRRNSVSIGPNSYCSILEKRVVGLLKTISLHSHIVGSQDRQIELLAGFQLHVQVQRFGGRQLHRASGAERRCRQ